MTMAATSKFDLSSSSPDGPAYPNGQRGGSYTSASLDRSGSFREGMESRVPPSLPSMSRSGSSLSHGEVTNFLQSLLADTKAMVAEQKLPRQGEIKRVLTSALGISPEDSSSVSFSGRSLPASSVEEIKRVKSSLHDSSTRASNRMKTLTEAISKFDKYFGVLSRKRSRSDVSLSERSNTLLPGDRPVLGGSIAKMGPQGHLTSNSSDLGPQKSEERTKNGVPNKRVRTSMVDVRMDVRANGLARTSGPMDRDRDMFRLVNGGAIQSEEKGRTLQTGVDGWEKSKMRKKRSGIKSDVSASAVLTRPLDGDREPKRGMQQRLGNDGRSRLSNVHGFRSGPANGAGGVAKLDITPQQSSLGMRSTPRSDQDIGSLPNDRRDRLVGSDKERVTLKAVNKANIREDSSAASPTSITKINAPARAPRSSSGAIPKSSQTVHRAIGTPDDWEIPQNTNRLHAVVGANNRKRSTPARSSSPPVRQWGGQRPQKISRIARRSNFVPLVSSHDEAPASDTVANVVGNDNGLGFPRRSATNATQQTKLKSDHISSAGLSESEESAAADNKSKDKGKKSGEIDEKGGPIVVQKVATLVLPSRKNKVASDEDLGDGVRRQGRTGRGFAPTRSSLPPTIEKLDNTVTAKQHRSARLGSDKIESKAGRPPTKKLSDRKSCIRPRSAVNSGSSEFSGESDDDHEELLAAASAAVNPTNACSGSFWKQMEPVFGFVSGEDNVYLKQQIRLVDEFVANIPVPCDTDPNSMGDLGGSSLTSTPVLACRDDCGTVSNGVWLNECERDMGLAGETKQVEPLQEQLTPGMESHGAIPLYQRLLAALISEEETEAFCCSTKGRDDCFRHDAYGSGFELNAESKSNSLNQRSLENLQSFGRATSNGYRITATRKYHDELEHDELESDGMVANTPNGLQQTQAAISEIQYDQMSLDERLLLELQSIELLPEPVPDLAQKEDEEISEDISRLEEELHEQVMKKKSMLLKLEKAVMAAIELQEREKERRALDKLVGMAYDKYMACWGPNVSGGKSASSKNSKQAALAFVKRTLGRCHQFEDSGRSCFNDPAFKDIFLSASSQSNDAECIDVITDGEAANQYADNPSHPSEMRVSAQLGSDHTTCLISRPGQDMDTHEKYSSDAFQSVNHLMEQAFGKDDTWSNRVKKRELLLDDVVGGTVGTSLRTHSGLGSSILSGTKGKRSERDREGKGHNREVLSRNGTAKIGRPSLGNIKGERKAKAKPKQKMTQLSASVNGLLGKASELPKAVLPLVPKSRDTTIVVNTKEKDEMGLLSTCRGMQDTSNDSEAAIDLSHLQLPGIDVLGVTDDFDGQGQDLGSWLNNIDDDGLQDHDFMGLEIPMDDLSDLNMMV